VENNNSVRAGVSVSAKKMFPCALRSHSHTVLRGDAEPDVIKSRLLSTKSFHSRVENNNSVRAGVSLSAKTMFPCALRSHSHTVLRGDAEPDVIKSRFV
jgi:hypothetical protein